MQSTESMKSQQLVLASGSSIRAQLLRQVGLSFDLIPAAIDEGAIKSSLLSEGAKPRDIADALAEYKARKISSKHPNKTVIGSDQVLEFEGTVVSKPETPDALKSQLAMLQGKTHRLHAAAVIYQEAVPKWRAVKTVSLAMVPLSEPEIDNYVAEYWDEVKYCVGGYRVEAEGLRLFSRIDGDYFAVLGIPLLDVVSYLRLSGQI